MYPRQNILGNLVLTAGILASVICQAQEDSAKPSLAQLLRQLGSSQWRDRARAYEKLRSDSKLLSDYHVQEGLLDLLDREDQLIESTLRSSNEQVGVSDKYGEEYSEYLGNLGEAVDSFADWNDARQVCICVHESYNPESRFAAKIAMHGKIALPCLMRMYGSDIGLARAEAAPLIVQALAKVPAGSLGDKAILAAKRLVLKALRDSSEAVRIDTIEALGSFGGEDMIPALKQMAESDPAAPAANGDSIRKWAAAAIAEIEKRAGR
jgi:hypothetical protein